MADPRQSNIGEVVKTHQRDLLTDWLRAQMSAETRRDDLIKDADLRSQSTEFLSVFSDALASADGANVQAEAWNPVRETLRRLSSAWTQQGFTPTEVATFVLSLKQPLLERLRKERSADTAVLTAETWAVSNALDQLALYTVEVYQKTREDVIARQQDEMLELSTPVVKLWDGILALPMIGTLDSSRTQVVMESLLDRIVETGAEIAILDITGVPTVDTLVAQHLIKTVTAARLMGADCIISGIRPQIAQTIVHLGVDLKDVITKASLADAFALALQRLGMRVVRQLPANQPRA
ncbi:MAG TPA: STAS domain-containing protein [Tepidisphaeraceae bacterium]